MTQQKAKRPSDFLDALAVMQRECGVDNIKLSDWGITGADAERITQNAIDTGQMMFDADPRFLNREEITKIYLSSIR